MNRAAPLIEVHPKTQAKCSQDLCEERAISFSRACWAHTDQASYLVSLPEAIRQAAQQPSTSLYLKKIECEGIDFSNLKLTGSSFNQAKLSRCAFVGCDLSGANFIGSHVTRCDFVGADLTRANFSRAYLSHSSFSFADLTEACLVEIVARDTDFLGAVLWRVNLWNADISGAAHIKRKNFYDPAKPTHPYKARLQEDDPLVALEAYRLAKHYFNQKGLARDASWAAYRELTMERKHFWRSKDLRYIPSLLMDLLSGYTEKPNRVIMASIGAIFLFGLIYFLSGAIRPTLDPGHAVGLWDSIYFSFVTFTTVGFGDFVPKPHFVFRLLVCVESFSGPFMAGLYIFTLTRRYSAH